MFLLFGAFIAGLLTVVAPCVLPLLPIIIGGSLGGNKNDKKRPLIVSASLAVSIIVFTVLLKVTALLINIPPKTLTYTSGTIIILLGLFSLFPLAYAQIMARLGLEHRALSLLGKGSKNKDSLAGPIITGAALGPVFSSCSPVYAYILATILPVNFLRAFSYIIAYVLGLSLILLVVSFYGKRAVGRLKFASNPNGWFQRTIAVLFIVVGVLIFTGYSVRVQTWVSDHTPFNFDALSAKLLPANKHAATSNADLNVKAYPAPELTGIQSWINSNPLTLSQLHGKVVLVDFWTYSCINCIRSIPYVEGWYQLYKDNGFDVIGIEAPEFSFEKVPSNVADAVKADKITYPVAIDGNLSTWNAFQNQYWPADYLIDQQGNVRRTDFGEGNYAKTESAIRSLLQANGAKLPAKTVTTGKEVVPVSAQETPETYLGLDRESNYEGSPDLDTSARNSFTATKQLDTNAWTLGGNWEISGDHITSAGNSTITIRSAAKEVYVVAGASTPTTVSVSFNGKPIGSNAGADVTSGKVVIGESRLYRLVNSPNFTVGNVTLGLPTGVDLNTFTFGG